MNRKGVQVVSLLDGFYNAVQGYSLHSPTS